MNQNKKTWEEFWEWVCDEAIGQEYEAIDDWLGHKEIEWEGLVKCEDCGKRGILPEKEFKHSYLIKKREFCPHCNKYFNEEDLWEEAKAKAKADIESGRISPIQAMGLVDAFGFVAGEFKGRWIQGLIIENNEERYALLERMNRKIENAKDET